MRRERESRFRENPQNISPGVVDELTAELLGTIINKYFSRLIELHREDLRQDIFSTEFLIFRIGVLGFEEPIDPEDIKKYSLKFKTISTLGLDDETDSPQETSDDPYEWSYDTALNTVKAFIYIAYKKEANKRSVQAPDINRLMMDHHPVKRDLMTEAKANVAGLYMYDLEETLDKFKLESPELFSKVVEIKDQLVEYYTPDTLRFYGKLPEEFITKITPKIKERWNEDITEWIARMYAMLTPTPPELIEVTNVEKK